MTPQPVCAVCRTLIPIRDTPHYANPFEKVRKKAPCCSQACAARFNPDLHWLPAVIPGPAEETEQARRLPTIRNRLALGEPPRVVVREALLAGMTPTVLRANLLEIVAARDEAAQAAESRAIGWTFLGLLGSLFSRRATMTESTLMPFDKVRIAEALDDLDRWEAARAA